MSGFLRTGVATAARSVSLWFVLLILFSLTGQILPAHAAIAPEGDVTPFGGTWTSSTTGYIGNTGSGTLTVNDGCDLLSYDSYIGYGSSATGVVNVSGTGSTWNNIGTIYVGNQGGGTLSITNGGCVSSKTGCIGSPKAACLVTVDGAGSTWNNSSSLSVGGTWWTVGNGILSITNGGYVSVAGDTQLSMARGSSGAIQFGTNGGTLTTHSLFASPSQLSGTGTINTCGLVSDIDLRFDATHPLAQTRTLQQSGQNITVNLDMATSPSTNGALGAGLSGIGSLTIKDGIKVQSDSGYIGFGNSSTGVVTVAGAGSTWNNTGNLNVGYNGGGTLNITNGGSVTSSYGSIGLGSNSKCIVKVDGASSAWTTGDIYVGGTKSGGSYTLSITGGGTVTATSVSTNSVSLMTIDVGRGSLLKASGSVTNSGTIRILAGAGVAANGTAYSPIAAGGYSGTGTYQAVGGTWSSTNHTFTASSVAAGTSSVTLTLDRAAKQRVLVADNASGGTNWKLGASFLAAGTTSNMTFTATAAKGATLDALKTAAGNDQTVLSGWTFTTTDYTLSSSLPVYFSFDVGDYSSDELTIWGFDGSDWAAYTANDLTCDGTYASFTATGLSGYAVTVPEPGTLVLLAMGLLGLVTYARRKQP